MHNDRTDAFGNARFSRSASAIVARNMAAVRFGGKKRFPWNPPVGRGKKRSRLRLASSADFFRRFSWPPAEGPVFLSPPTDAAISIYNAARKTHRRIPETGRRHLAERGGFFRSGGQKIRSAGRFGGLICSVGVFGIWVLAFFAWNSLWFVLKICCV